VAQRRGPQHARFWRDGVERFTAAISDLSSVPASAAEGDCDAHKRMDRSIGPSPVPHPLLFLISTSLTVELSMQNRTDTLEIGSRAPDFSLGAANREGTFTLADLLAQGTLILEFLRGTW